MSTSVSKILNPPVELVKKFLHYDPVTGFFTWRERGRNPAMAGRTPLSRDGCGYVRFSFKGVKYRAHRLAWFYVTGAWPAGEIDHINGMRADNRWKNLREATRSLNMQNRRSANEGSATGILGVYKNAPGFRSQIKIGGKQIFLGVFKTASAASRAYMTAKRKLHPGATI